MRRPLLILVAWLCAWPALADPEAAAAPRFEAKDLFALEQAVDPQFRPDGVLIAYVRESNDIMVDRPRRSIWLIEPRTGVHKPLLTGPDSYTQPRWSPLGDRLAYVSNAEGGGSQLFVYWLAERRSARITGLPNSPSAIAWSPDGRYLAYCMFVPEDGPRLGEGVAKPEGAQWAAPLELVTEMIYRSDGIGTLKPGHTQVFVVAADGGAPRQLTSGPYDHDGPLSWTPDGRSVLLSAYRSNDRRREPIESEVYRVSVADGTIEILTSRRGPDIRPAASPDGRRIAYLGFDDKLVGYRDRQLYVLDADGSNRRVLTEALNRGIDSFQWSADGASLFVQYSDRGRARIASVSLQGKVRELVVGLVGSDTDRPWAGGEFSVSRGGDIAFTSGSADRPSDISVWSKGATTRLTRLNDGLLAGKTLARVQPLAVTSSFDKRPIDAWIMTPPGFEPTSTYPMILEIHGGPFDSYGPAFSTDMQLFAAAGYVVLYANPRGSASYGEGFANLIQNAFPGRDYDDLMSAVDAAVATGFVDPANLFVTGGSAGGALTAWIIGQNQRFRAAAMQKPVVNWTTFVLTSDTYAYTSRHWFEKLPWEAPHELWLRSPLSLVGKVETPTLIIAAAEDYRAPVSEAEQYYQALQLKGVPTALVIVPGASHGSFAARPSQSAARVNAILAWFDRYRRH